LNKSDFEKVYDPNFVYHFGTWIDKRKIRIYLDRDNYCKIDKKSYTKVPAQNEILENWEKWEEQKKTIKFDSFYTAFLMPRIKI